MKQQVLLQNQVKSELTDRFVAVQIDLTDQSADNPNAATAQTYQVRGIPTVFAMTPEGKVIGTYPGGPSPDAFLAWLNGIEVPDR